MSATEAIHGSKPNPIGPRFNDLRYVLPQLYMPTKDTRVMFRGKHGDVDVPPICWGAWSWGDKATWHWLDDEYPALQQA
jgi:hypothetical protein